MTSIYFRGREDKLAILAHVLRDYLSGSVLDVGCDRGYLRSFVKGRYVGIDIAGRPECVVDLEYGLPFRDGSFDAVVAFDVLEHLNKIHYACDELFRVARHYVVIGLPNPYELRFRVKFLLGKPISGKYGLPIEPPSDRHRWLFTLDEARKLVTARGGRYGFSLEKYVVGYYKYRQPMLRLIMGAISRSRILPNVFAYYGVFVLGKGGCNVAGEKGLGRTPSG